MHHSVRKIVLGALLAALSIAGAQVKILGTVALDSLPAFVASLMLGWASGGVIAFLGHSITALTSGFPLGVPVHLAAAFFTALAVGVYKGVVFVMQKRRCPPIVIACAASLAAAAVNGPLALYLLIPLMGKGFFFLFLLPLSCASFINALAGYYICALLEKRALSQRREG